MQPALTDVTGKCTIPGINLVPSEIAPVFSGSRQLLFTILDKSQIDAAKTGAHEVMMVGDDPDGTRISFKAPITFDQTR